LEADSVRARFPSRFTILPLGFIMLSAVAALADVRVFTEDEVRARFVVQRGTLSYLVVEGEEWELVTRTDDPAIANPGDGSFHPMSAAHVRMAAGHVDTFTRPLTGKILILPYPRRNTLKSSCGQGVVFLSPGVREVAPEHVHAITCHEIGHLFQAARVPQGSAVWNEYVELRGLRDPRFHDHATHRDRPREIFAEDFRFLFGTALATIPGSIENPDLPLPSAIPGLCDWFRRLARLQQVVTTDALDPRPICFPNPYRNGGRGAVFLQFPVTAMGSATLAPRLPADVFDSAGRRVRTLGASGTASGGRLLFVWDGRNTQGAEVAPGLYFVRLREYPAAGAARVHILR
jgi:hypothetical protein